MKSSDTKTTTRTDMNQDDLLPVSLLCGFLGAGKTTMMKYILETKHEDPDFKCAVIVNDMAALNIDKSLIDQSAVVQSDEVIAMQNGCFCCTLQSDLVDQIITLTKMNRSVLSRAIQTMDKPESKSQVQAQSQIEKGKGYLESGLRLKSFWPHTPNS